MLIKCNLKFLVSIMIGFLLTASGQSQTLTVPADSSHWNIQGRANVTEYQGRKCFSIYGGEALLNNYEMRDGVIDLDVETTSGGDFSVLSSGLIMIAASQSLFISARINLVFRMPYSTRQFLVVVLTGKFTMEQDSQMLSIYL